MNEKLIKSLMPLLHSKAGRAGLMWWQDHLLRRTILHASQHSPFYRRKFAELGLSPGLVKRQEDLPRLGFFTTPKDLQADPFDFLAVPKSDCVHIMSTSGTTGRPKTTFYSQHDWNNLVSKIHSGLILVDIGPGDVCQIMLCSGTPTWMGGTLLQAGLERRGCLIVPVGNTLSPQAQLETMARFGSNYLFSTPSYIHRITEEGKRLADLRSFGIKHIYLGSEPNSKAFRSYLEESWGALVYDGYGMMEFGAGIGGECSQRNGYHLDLFIAVEVIDPATNEPVAEGREGELVFTSLGRDASPLLRYRSGDIARLLPNAPCPCGTLPTRKMSNILGRTDDMLFLGTGENFTPLGLDQLMVAVPGVSGYQLVVSRDGYKDLLVLRIESSAPSPELTDRILDRLYDGIPFLRHDVHQSQTIAEPTIEFLKPGTLASESPIKVHRVIDTRTQVTGSR